MNTLEILERLKLFTEDWGVETNRLCGNDKSEAFRLARKAYFDFKSLKVQIEKSLDEMAEGMEKQELDSLEESHHTPN